MPAWEETYYALTGRAWIKDLPGERKSDRSVQLRASLPKLILEILTDLEAIPGFPKGTRERLANRLERQGRITGSMDLARN